MPVNPYRPKRHPPKPYWIIWALGAAAGLSYAFSFVWPLSFVLGFVLTIACWLVNWGLSGEGINVRQPPR